MSPRDEERGPRRHGVDGGKPQRRNAKGRERNRPAASSHTQSAPSQRTRKADPARLAAFEVLRAVAEEDAYANLVLPTRIRENRLDKRGAGFATELAYGALRGQGTYDAILAECVDRPLVKLDPAILDALRIGAHQLLAMRVPPHAALDQTVGLARAVIGAGPATLINAVLRRVTAKDLPGWLDQITSAVADPTKSSALRHSHPEWVVRALRQSLVVHGRDAAEIEQLLAANNAAPVVNLVALPGIGDLTEALEAGGRPGTLVEGSALYSEGDVGRLSSVRDGTTRVQDAGSQLVARALTVASTAQSGDPRADGSQAGNGDGPNAGDDNSGRTGERWLDLCAGPGGKAALLASLAAQRGATLLANEPAPHRAKLVRQALSPIPAATWDVRVEDGRSIGEEFPEYFDRILVDAPCTGLGALRRRPEARWRRKPSDLADLGPLQRGLLQAALDAARRGGIVAYATCSPHPAETTAVVTDVLNKRDDAELIDAGTTLDKASLSGELNAGAGMTAQLWPHIHQTDAMFLALIRKT
ncbi:RsmB/NOP family class I SAM-dependent RNA methyltransferase [Arthrobacter sp. H14]|uniref:RsmB/NOP family class I SAM-dependent RNA methyltransferase n=1 Tax=Arthrobacter sp. H14 TaxID=1312959 RepID=UPI0004ACBF37|nr:transcription antitermination factor NusB [Arthrobacter sp. H14]